MTFNVGDKVTVNAEYPNPDFVGREGTVYSLKGEGAFYPIEVEFDGEYPNALFTEKELDWTTIFAVGDRVTLVRPWSDGVEGNTGTVREIVNCGKFKYSVERDHDGLMGLCSADELGKYERDLEAEVDNLTTIVGGLIDWIEAFQHQDSLDIEQLGNRVSALETTAVATLSLIRDELAT